MDDPQIVVAVIVEHGGHGGSTAAPIAQKVLSTWFDKQRARAGEAVAGGPEPEVDHARN